MKLFLIFLSVAVSSIAFSFEGVVSCKKVENGVNSYFKFYIKGDQIAIVSDDASDKTKILFNRSANSLQICVDNVDPSQKGYYELNSQNTQKQDAIVILEKYELEKRMIDGLEREGLGVKTNQGTASAYFGSEEIDIRGFSTFFNDPVYEVIDASSSNKLPIELRVNTSNSNYVIYLSVEKTLLDDSIFEIPQGFRKFEVKAQD